MTTALERACFPQTGVTPPSPVSPVARLNLILCCDSQVIALFPCN